MFLSPCNIRSDTEGKSAVSSLVKHFSTFGSDCRGPNNSIQFVGVVQDWEDFDLFRKASIVVIALGTVSLVKTVDQGFQTLTSGQEKFFQGFDFADHFFCNPD